MATELSPSEKEYLLSILNQTICETLDQEFVANISELSEICSHFSNKSSIPTYVFLIFQIVYTLVCVLGLIGNSLVIYVVLRFSNLHTVTNTYILHLAITDECFLLGLPFLISTTALKEWPFGNVMCKIYFISTSINQITSSLFLMILSADRYVAVCHPIYSPTFRTEFIARVVSLSAWLLSCLLMIPVFLYATTVTHYDGSQSCNIVWSLNSTSESILNKQNIFILYSLVFGFLGPLFLILIFYLLVIVKLRSVGPNNDSRAYQNKRKVHRKVTKLVLTVITVYIICWLPHWITQVILISKQSDNKHFLIIVVLITTCLSYSNSAMNPVLYAFLSDNFKKSFQKAFQCARFNRSEFINTNFSFTTRRSRRGQRFTSALQEESTFPNKATASRDISTGITSASSRSKSGSTTSEVRLENPYKPSVINGMLAPPQMI